MTVVTLLRANDLKTHTDKLRGWSVEDVLRVGNAAFLKIFDALGSDAQRIYDLAKQEGACFRRKYSWRHMSSLFVTVFNIIAPVRNLVRNRVPIDE